MAFKEELVANTKSDASAYMQFISGREREGFDTYAFVEDDDDMVFYQHALIDHDHIGYLPCGGKENVMKVFRKLHDDSMTDKLLFFVDRDTEQHPYQYSDEVCRTELYSWESYVFQPETCSCILGRRYRPNLTPSQRKDALKSWSATVDHYRDLLSMHTALTRLAKDHNVSLGMREIALAKKAIVEDTTLHPNPDLDTEIAACRERAYEVGIVEADIAALKAHYLGTDLLNTARGKSVFQIFRQFLSTVEKRYKRKFFGEFSSPIPLLSCMSNQHVSLNFIRDYVSRRMAIMHP